MNRAEGRSDERIDERTDERTDAKTEALELGVAKFLRAGVIVAGALLAAGWVLSLRSGNPLEAFGEYAPIPYGTAVRAAWRERDVSLLLSFAGLTVLVALPPLRVFFTAIQFARSRERVLASIAVFVLVVLVASFLLGWDVG